MINMVKSAPKYIKFQLNRNGKSIPYTFHANEVIKVPQYDIAIVHTKENMSKYAKPMRIATDSEIKKLKFNTPLYSLGYSKLMVTIRNHTLVNFV